MPNYLSRYDAETLPSFDQCVKFNGSKVIFTTVGIARYKERFARAGFDIAKISEAEQLGLALEASWHIEMECFSQVSLERRATGNGDPVECSHRDATRSGDRARAAQLLQKLRHRRRVSLKLLPRES